MIYGLGNWGRLRTGGEFWKKWNPNTQIRVMTWNEDLPLHIGWDKNVNPYLPCSIWQFVPVGDTLELCQIGEIALEDPKNRTKDVCEALKARYPAGRVKGLFVYGDATAIREDTETEKGENMYTSIFKHLKDYHPTRRVPEANPSVVESGNFVDQVHADNIEGLRLFVDPSCKKSIFDYTYALEDSEGGISKKMKMNKVTKVSYQEFGHFSDIKRYIIAKAFSEKYYDYKRGGKSKPAKSGKSAPSKHGY
jgi:phage terminase large subunit